MTSADAVLARTLLLARDHIPSSVSEQTIVDAFRGTTVGVVVAASNLTAPGFVVALETLRVLLAGLCVAIRIEVRGRDNAVTLQAPFGSGPWLEELVAFRAGASSPLEAGRLDDTCRCRIGLGVADGVDFELAADGDAYWLRRSGVSPRWPEASIWGGAGAAVLAAAEVYKVVIGDVLGDGHGLAALRQSTGWHVDPAAGPDVDPTPRVEVISGGAIANAMIFMAIRSGRRQTMRVWDDDAVEASNFNRYPLLDVVHLGVSKVEALAGLNLGPVSIEPVQARFDAESEIGAATFVVGADQIAPRHEVARRRPDVAIVGSTHHFLTLDSYHRGRLEGCPACLHPRDDGVRAEIPTVSFVSFAAGLDAARFLARPPAATSWYSLTSSWLRLDGDMASISGAVPRIAACPVPEAHS